MTVSLAFGAPGSRPELGGTGRDRRAPATRTPAAVPVDALIRRLVDGCRQHTSPAEGSEAEALWRLPRENRARSSVDTGMHLDLDLTGFRLLPPVPALHTQTGPADKPTHRGYRSSATLSFLQLGGGMNQPGEVDEAEVVRLVEVACDGFKEHCLRCGPPSKHDPGQAALSAAPQPCAALAACAGSTRESVEARRARNELARQLYPVVRRRVCSRLPRTDADDVVQDVLIKVQERLCRYKPERARFLAYVNMITSTTIIDHWRTLGRGGTTVPLGDLLDRLGAPGGRGAEEPRIGPGRYHDGLPGVGDYDQVPALRHELLIELANEQPVWFAILFLRSLGYSSRDMVADEAAVVRDVLEILGYSGEEIAKLLHMPDAAAVNQGAFRGRGFVRMRLNRRQGRTTP